MVDKVRIYLSMSFCADSCKRRVIIRPMVGNVSSTKPSKSTGIIMLLRVIIIC